MAKPKILILTGDAAESLEVMYPYQRLQEEGYDVQIAAPTKKKLRFVVHDFEKKKPVAQLCHAPLALIAAGVIKGRRTAAYPALEPDVQAAGAEFVNSEAVVDGVMVSARAWPDHPAFMREFIKILRQAAPISRDATAGR